jgi:threonine synthase
VAESIQVGNPVAFGRAPAALRESKGTAVALSDAEILEAQFNRQPAGVFADPLPWSPSPPRASWGAASSVAMISLSATSPPKQPKAIRISKEDIRPIAPTLEALREQVGRSPS